MAEPKEQPEKVPTPHPREVEAGHRVYGTTPEEVIRWVRDARPPVEAADVLAKLTRLQDAGLMNAEGAQKVRAAFPELEFTDA